MATTTGFVQRLNWLSGGPTACAWIGSAPGASEAFTVQIASGDSDARIRFKQSMVNLLVEAQLAGREVVVTHASGSSVVESVATTACNVTSTPLQVDGIEVTQAIQDLGHSIPLLARKRTVVRVYLSYYATPGITVRGRISIRRGPTDTPVTIASANTVVLDPAHAGNLPIKREDAARSLNFVLPSSHITMGPLSIRLVRIRNNATNSIVNFGCEHRPTVWFHRAAPIRVRVLGMRYTQSGLTHTPSNLDFDLVESWLRRAMPTGRVNMSRAIVDATSSVPFTCDSINAQLAAIRALDVAGGSDARTHYYGLVSDGGFFMRGCAAGIPQTPQPDTVASGPTGSANWGWDFDGSYGDWYTGHELGHTYGRRHPGFCGETQSDLDNFPFTNGQLANSSMSFAGFDVGDPASGLAMAALPGTQWHDVMTYCDFQWLCPYTYLGVRRRLADENDLAAGPGSPGAGPGSGSSASGGRPDGRFPWQSQVSVQRAAASQDEVLVSVVATVNLTRRKGKIEFVNPLERATPSKLLERGEATVRVKGSDGTVLADYPIEVKLSSELAPDEDRVGIVDAIIVVNTDARSIELLLNNHVADTFLVGGAAPSVGALGVEDVGGNAVAITMRVDKKDTEYQRFSIQVSTDDGQTWQTVAVGLKDPSTTVDRSQFLKGQDVRVRVLATNGLATSVVAAEAFRV
jgi:hypothetical protein